MAVEQDRTKRGTGHARSGPLLRPRTEQPTAPPRHQAPPGTPRKSHRAAPSSRRLPLAAGAAVAVALLAAGAAAVMGGDDGPDTQVTARGSASAGPSASATAPPPTPTATATATDGGSALSPAVQAATSDTRTADDARLALEQVLAARADAMNALLLSALRGDAAGAAAAEADLAQATRDLTAVVTVWSGSDLADQLSSGLTAQSAASRDYATAVAAGDVPAADRARAQMAEVSRQLGTALDAATAGRIAAYVPPQDAAQYRAYVDALQAGDVAAADEVASWLRARLTREGRALGLGLAPQS